MTFDPDFASVSLLLSGEHLQDETFTNTFIVNGSAGISTDLKKVGASSIQFDGIDDSLQVLNNHTANFGQSDFTIEAWVYPTLLTGYRCVFAVNGGQGALPKIIFGLYSGVPRMEMDWLPQGITVRNASRTVQVNTWTHLAYVRFQGTWSWYINGSLSGSGSDLTDIVFTDEQMFIGYGGEKTAQHFRGNIDELRVSKIARYTAAGFVPSVEPFPTKGEPTIGETSGTF
jgi:hypothetical protein